MFKRYEVSARNLGPGLMTRVAPFLLAALCLSGCGEPAVMPDTRQAAPVPEQVCNSAEEALEGLKAQLVLDYAPDGTATLPQEVWLAQDTAARDSLVRSLAYHSSCKSPQPLIEKEVIIRNETGVVLERRTIEMAINPATPDPQ